MKTAIFSLAFASFVAMAVSVAPAADLACRYERNIPRRITPAARATPPGALDWFAQPLIAAGKWPACAWAIAPTV